MPEQVKAVTLIEILTVVLIIGILIALALPNFGTMKERALDREAKANLKLIQAAEKIYRMEYLVYQDAGDTGEVNQELKLSLPAGDNSNWLYSITGGNELDARVTRNIDASDPWYREFKIDASGEPCCVSGRCPSDIPSCP
jgi:type IV pilus assembly protein PilE